jgi:hypothetical protein
MNRISPVILRCPEVDHGSLKDAILGTNECVRVSMVISPQ